MYTSSFDVWDLTNFVPSYWSTSKINIYIYEPWCACFWCMAGVGVDHTHTHTHTDTRTHARTHAHTHTHTHRDTHTHTANMTTITRQFLIICTIVLCTNVTAFYLNTKCYQRLTRKEATSNVSTSLTCSCGQALQLTTQHCKGGMTHLSLRHHAPLSLKSFADNTTLQRRHNPSLSPSPCTLVIEVLCWQHNTAKEAWPISLSPCTLVIEVLCWQCITADPYKQDKMNCLCTSASLYPRCWHPLQQDKMNCLHCGSSR